MTDKRLVERLSIRDKELLLDGEPKFELTGCNSSKPLRINVVGVYDDPKEKKKLVYIGGDSCCSDKTFFELEYDEDGKNLGWNEGTCEKVDDVVPLSFKVDPVMRFRGRVLLRADEYLATKLSYPRERFRDFGLTSVKSFPELEDRTGKGLVGRLALEQLSKRIRLDVYERDFKGQVAPTLLTSKELTPELVRFGLDVDATFEANKNYSRIYAR